VRKVETRVAAAFGYTRGYTCGTIAGTSATAQN